MDSDALYRTHRGLVDALSARVKLVSCCDVVRMYALCFPDCSGTRNLDGRLAGLLCWAVMVHGRVAALAGRMPSSCMRDVVLAWLQVHVGLLWGVDVDEMEEDEV